MSTQMVALKATEQLTRRDVIDNPTLLPRTKFLEAD